jgi:hypothetical protein
MPFGPGRVASFSPDFEADHRELVLMPPLRSRAPESAGNGLAPVPGDFQRVVLAGSQITSLAVQYREPRDGDRSPSTRRMRARDRMMKTIALRTMMAFWMALLGGIALIIVLAVGLNVLTAALGWLD